MQYFEDTYLVDFANHASLSLGNSMLNNMKVDICGLSREISAVATPMWSEIKIVAAAS